MERLALLQARIGHIGELLDVVSTMRSLAAVRMQQAGDALAGAREYAEIIGVSLARALTLAPPEAWPRPPGDGRPGLLVFTSEHGFVGAFNEVLMDAAQDILADGGQLFVVGTRGRVAARDKGVRPAWTLPMTSHRDGVPAVARRIAAEIYRRFQQGEITRLEMAFAAGSGTGGGWTIRRQSLLPLDLEAFPPPHQSVPPLHALPPERLISGLVEEYFLAELVRGAMESLSSENAARFAAMSAARENITRRLDELHRLEHQVRQEEITTELLDVITGAMALMPQP